MHFLLGLVRRLYSIVHLVPLLLSRTIEKMRVMVVIDEEEGYLNDRYKGSILAVGWPLNCDCSQRNILYRQNDVSRPSYQLSWLCEEHFEFFVAS